MKHSAFAGMLHDAMSGIKFDPSRTGDFGHKFDSN
jgi:hypothetical protein